MSQKSCGYLIYSRQSLSVCSGGNATEPIFLLEIAWLIILKQSILNQFCKISISCFGKSELQLNQIRGKQEQCRIPAACSLPETEVGLRCLVLRLVKPLSFLHTESLNAMKWLIPRAICVSLTFFFFMYLSQTLKYL